MRNSPAVVYIHGFNNWPASSKAQQLQNVIAQIDQFVLVCSSLGGFYAIYLVEQYHSKALLINPAVGPQHLCGGFLAEQESLYSGERKQLTELHLQGFAALKVAPSNDAQRFFVWLQSTDETLDYCLTEQCYHGCSVQIEQGGNHGFQRFTEQLSVLFTFVGVEFSVLQSFNLSALE